MPLNTHVASTAAGSIALFLAGIDSVPATKSIADRIWRKSLRHDEPALAKAVYRDEDGEASKDSLQAFSDKWQRVAIALFSASGFSVTLAQAVLSTLEVNTSYTTLNWLQLGIWVCRIELGDGVRDRKIPLTWLALL